MRKKLPLKLQKIEILGVLVNVISLESAVSLVNQWVNTNKQYQITTPNPEQIVLAQKNLAFKKALNRASLAIPDGVGLVWAMKKRLKVQGLRFKVHRVSGVDLMVELCRLAAKKSWRVFLLGGKNGSAAKAAFKLQASSFKWQAKKLRITDYGLRITSYEGAEDIKNETQQERRETIRRINQFRPHLLFVAYGAPEQELWIAKNLPKLKVKVAMGVGGAFDYISGRVPRASRWVRRLGLEWLYRLIREPWRLKRQLRLLEFVRLVISDLR